MTGGGGIDNLDCRYDVFEIATWGFSPVSKYMKGDTNIQDRRCRYPVFREQVPSTNASKYVILMITEYFSTAKAGFLRIKLQSDYTQETA